MGKMGNISQNKKFLMPGDARINDKCPTLINSRHDYSLIILKNSLCLDSNCFSSRADTL